MVRKTYSYPGIAQGDILVKVGMKGHIRIPFRNGYLDKKMSRPATYSTGDPVMQSIIEKSELFGHRIFLKDIYGADEPNGADQTVENSEKKEYPEVKTFDEAVAVLKSLPGVKATTLRTHSSAQKVAAINGIVFPNYNWDSIS